MIIRVLNRSYIYHVKSMLGNITTCGSFTGRHSTRGIVPDTYAQLFR
jgi:hypothetical protein